MSVQSPVRAAAALAVGLLCGCGTRTGLLVPEQGAEGQGDSVVDASTDATDAADAAEEPVFSGVRCSLYSGPVDSCDASASAGPVQDCTGNYSVCIRVFEPGSGVPYGQWGCCLPKPPENVPQCLDRQFLDAGCL
jgi:hypothetical protein